MRRAKKVIVPNEFLQKILSQRYKVATTIVRNPHDSQKFPAAKKNNKNFTIVYTGAIYEAQLEPVQLLAKTVNNLHKSGYKIKFDIYTPDSEEQLAKNNLTTERSAAVSFFPPISKEEAQNKQAKADLLYLPLAANTRYPEIIKTSCPGKMSEYLNSGTPIFAHVPNDSYVAWYLQKKKAGLVCTKMSVHAITSKLKEILQDKKLLTQFHEPALEAAKDFNVEDARRNFIEAVSS